MPRYRYECGYCGNCFSYVHPVPPPPHVQCENCEERAEYRPSFQCAKPSTWSNPLLSDALAVHPSQVKEAYEDSVKKGVPTEFLADGRAVLRSREHRRKYLKAYGFYDKDGGYGDG